MLPREIDPKDYSEAGTLGGRMLDDPQNTARLVPLAASCCTTHDGPHLHGCVLPRRPDGRDHDGACVLCRDCALGACAADHGVSA